MAVQTRFNARLPKRADIMPAPRGSDNKSIGEQTSDASNLGGYLAKNEGNLAEACKKTSSDLGYGNALLSNKTRTVECFFTTVMLDCKESHLLKMTQVLIDSGASRSFVSCQAVNLARLATIIARRIAFIIV